MGKKQLTGLKCEKPIAVSKKKINNNNYKFNIYFIKSQIKYFINEKKN